MSAPIDDLLYGGDDSGDDDELNVPMSSFSAPLPATGALAMVAPPGTVPLGAPSAVLAPPSGLGGLGSVSAPPPMSAGSVSAPVSTMAAPRPLSATGTATATTAAAAAGPVKQQGSGHQMFQQMFALLKQMLPPEQYAALHSEMRNGNGNDIKSIVDIIKRIAGDAIFASVIQRMDLTRNHSAAAGSLGIVKAEPAAGAAPTSVATTTAGAARPTPIPRPVTTPPSTIASTPITQPLQPMSATNLQTTTATSAPAVAMQRPTLVAATAPQTTPPAVGSVKTEPVGSFTGAPLAPPPDVSVAIGSQVPSVTATTATPIDSVGGGKNETQEKIQFAKKLLFHASSCTLPPGNCQVKRCDDVRRVFKHSVSCGGARGCSHCRQLKALVEYHAKECLVPVGEHCKIPFCDGIRRNNAAARARAVSSGTTTAVPAATTVPSAPAGGVTPPLATPASTASVLSDDDEDNTPLASAVNKVKKNVKAKSPKSGPANPTATTPTAVAKKKVTPIAKPTTSTPPSTASTPSSTGSSTPAPAPAAVANKPKPASATLTQAQEYGRLLQLILHVEKCKTSTCPVGEDCVEAKTLLRQVNAPDAPVRAQTYKKVFAHYKVCLAKNNTQNCPMCKIGLLPIEVTTSTIGTTGSGTSQSPALAAPATVASSSSTTTASATSPSVGTLKRTNSSLASPRSPSKKPRLPTKGGKPEMPGTSAVAGVPDHQSLDLVSTSRNDLRKEEDVLTHTAIDLNTERRAMMDRSRRRHIPERLPCKKEEWQQNDLFNSDKLTHHVENIAKKHGVSIGTGNAAASTAQVMAHALHEYLKQIIEEMVEAAKLRGDVSAQALEVLVKKELGGAGALRELTSTDILRVSCDDSFVRLRQEDIALRTHLLEDAKREELAEKERSKKRKKVDRVKLQAQEEKDEAEMDLEELAVKDLKDRLLHEDKDGTIHVDGRVNESIATKLPRRVDDQVTMEDATFWLENQKPYINPKLFVRAEAARIVTKALL